MKIKVGLCSFLIVCLVSLIGCNSMGSSYNSDAEIENANIIGNTFGNISNGAFVAKQGEWIYLDSPYGFGTDMRIYKININTGKKVIVTKEGGYYLNVVGDWIYYICIPDKINKNYESDVQRLYKIKTDGTKRTKLTDDVVGGINIIGDWVYYIKERKVYKINTKGDNSETRLFQTDSAWSINIDNDWIYYVSEGAICKAKIDGSNKEIINNSKYAESINLSNGVIYYIERDDKKLYKIKTDGTNKTKINDDKVMYGINIIDEWIYYTSNNKDEEGDLFRVKTDGTLREKLADN